MSESHEAVPARDEPRLVVGAIIVRDGQVLAARRSRPQELAGSFEFPGGKVEPGEDAIDALVREVREELGVQVEVQAEFESMEGPWPIGTTMNLRVWFCELAQGEPAPGDSHDEVRWCAPGELPTLPWLPADQPIAEALAALAGRA